jgi:ABC-type transport system involved in multi-copper enzyme maturation permease subunit
LLLFFAPSTIAGIITSFVVYGKFTVESGDVEIPDPSVAIAMIVAGKLVQVHQLIVQSNYFLRVFALLVASWFGAGLIADDERSGAQQLYFSRPMTRLDYWLGHFLTTAFFGLLAVLAPGLVVCIVAVLASPDYAFLKEKWDVILATVGYALLYVGVLSALVLAVSSVAQRKAFALVALFALVVGSEAVAAVLSELQRDTDFFLLSYWSNFERIGEWMFGIEPQRIHWDWDPRYSLAIVGGVFAVSVGFTALRLRRMEMAA